MKAMILAAGLGTRLKPWTDKHPKALAPVNGKSLLQRNIEYLQRFGIYEVIVNTHHFAKQIVDVIETNKGWGSNITISDETDIVLETGGGLKKAMPFLKDEKYFVLINVDILTDLNLDDMISFHRRRGSLATLATTQRKTSRYFLFGEDNILCGWHNTETGAEKISRKANVYHQKAFSGIHVISNRIFSFMKREDEFSIIDVYIDAACTEVIQSFDHSNTRFIDVGKPETVNRAEMLFA